MVSLSLIENAEKEGIHVSEEVKNALLQNQPILSLESTILCHGMPYPQNYATFCEVEKIVRQNKCFPASIAILNGIPTIGLSTQEIELLAKMGSKAKKTSKRDIAFVVSEKLYGATTVSATIFFSVKVGIKIFVTGGIGGVHRNGQLTMDISSDLIEMGKNEICVVSAGAKSILDIPKTLEFLETQGVNVISFGMDDFPSFFTSNSGLKSPYRLDSVERCAALIETNSKLKTSSGLLFCIPIPTSQSANGQVVENAIRKAMAETHEKNIIGKDITPFLLKRVNEITQGKSLIANIALIKNNALIGSLIAKSLYFPKCRL